MNQSCKSLNKKSQIYIFVKILAKSKHFHYKCQNKVYINICIFIKKYYLVLPKIIEEQVVQWNIADVCSMTYDVIIICKKISGFI